MKSQGLKVDEFWRWFHAIAGMLSPNIENPALLEELDARVRDLDPKLSWEIGPGLSMPLRLVISPSGNRDLRERARAIVSHAPTIDGWEFHSSKPPKEWDYTFALKNDVGDLMWLDASKWTFVLLGYPDGAHEILLKGDDLSDLKEDERWQAAAITLESILGEEMFMDRIDQFEVVEEFELRFAERQRPIQELRQAVTGR